MRSQTLHAIEQGGNETGGDRGDDLDRRASPHLETMDRLDIEYDFLPRESEILHLHFWDAAFATAQGEGRSLLRERRKEQGLLGDATARDAWPEALAPKAAENCSATDRSGPDEDAKVIVRSNGTVGYVGKDIAYHLWKFGLLGRDFGYRKFLSLSQRP